MDKMTNAKALAVAIDLATKANRADVVEKLTKMKASVEKKNSAERKPTATQKENVGFKTAILAGMQENRLYTITELIKEIPAISTLTNQRVSAILRQMVDAGSVKRTEDKRKALFSKVATDEDDFEVED